MKSNWPTNHIGLVELEIGDVISISGDLKIPTHIIDFVNDCRAHAVALQVTVRKIETRFGKTATVSTRAETNLTSCLPPECIHERTGKMGLNDFLNGQRKRKVTK